MPLPEADGGRVGPVARTLADRGARVRALRFEAPTCTAEEAAAAAGCLLEQIVKSLVFVADGAPVMVLVAGHRRADKEKVARACGASAARLADPETALANTGYPVGVVPPAGHPKDLATVVDSALTSYDTVWVASGREDELIEIASADLVRVTGATVADVGR